MTAREKSILDYMQEQIKKNGYPPTVREICSALSIRSTSTVHKAIASLQNQGFIRKDPVKRRALEVIDPGNGEGPVRKGPAASDTDSGKAYPAPADVVDVPVIGRIAAGAPILAEQNIEDSFPLPSRFIGKGTNFMLTVHGDSMIEAGIFNGDYVLVNQQSTASNGDIVAAMITDGDQASATVKAFYKEDGHIRLQPRNSSMEPIIVDDCKILGIVKGVFRYLD